MTPALDKAALHQALQELAAIMERRGEHGRVYVVGGAAMMLAHSADRVTRDIDAAIVEGHHAVTDAARIIAERRGWPRTWLNEGASVYMPRPQERHGAVIFDHPALKVIAASREHMLAMKVQAARPSDEQDVDLLLREGQYRTVEQVEALVESVFPDEPLGERRRKWLAALVESAAAHRPPAPAAGVDPGRFGDGG